MSFRASPIITRRIDDSLKPESPDNVWLSKYYKWPVYSFEAAVECHRETHHPTVYNRPDEKLFVNVELDMRAAKAVILLTSLLQN
jgi:large subunit ribosomal protein L1